MPRWYGLVSALSLGAMLMAASSQTAVGYTLSGRGSPLTPLCVRVKAKSNHGCPSKNCKALESWTIVLDPGHGKDPRNGNANGRSHTGARGANGAWEDPNNLAVARRLESLLTSEGARVYLTRGEYNPGLPGKPGLRNRVLLAEQVHADIFISLHQDWSSKRTARGGETFYYFADSRPLAAIVQRHLVATTGLKDRGVHVGQFYVLKHTTMPAVLVEGGFLSNPEESALISSPAFHQKEADALNRAVLEYAEGRPRSLRWWTRLWPWRHHEPPRHPNRQYAVILRVGAVLGTAYRPFLDRLH
ncbi:N-acetylmuramoyl-L-alanine amidase [Sulfobacillus sp. DSM 109850]|uniref:N-acetylmuramoyl-L-alanine amidase n=2 Tax=Sulfobacillus harzensis TaxID=2729629 RepID=A0A7Y0L5J7_9FIRM|nr:N-acetylmuramoyl-L-alanine amidase [Sulfobacillus harzensis]